jgi:hypothetical protein
MSDDNDFDFKDAFFNLGKPENSGLCFAVTPEALKEFFAGDVENFPKPDFEHAIFKDGLTKNYIVCRPEFGGYDQWAHWERIR